MRNSLPLFLKSKLLRVRRKSIAGRGASGRIILWTKKSLKIKNVCYSVNWSFKSSLLGFIGNVSIVSSLRRVLSTFFLSSGASTYLATSYTHSLFSLTRMYPPSSSLHDRRNSYASKYNPTSTVFLIPQMMFFIRQLPRNQHISLLELKPLVGISYVRAPGSYAVMTKLDVYTFIALIRLPSGIRKVFSPFALGSAGPNPNKFNKHQESNLAGYYSNRGKKPIVRGVARNPIDHPHGGRTKALRYQQTPWGKPTKRK